MKKTILWNGFRYGLGFALLGYIVWRYWSPAQGQGLVQLWQKHVIGKEPIHAGYLALGAAICFASVLLTFVRWYLLVRAQELPFTLPKALRLGLIGYYLNTFLPGSVGGDIIKAAFIAREQSRRTVAVATVLIDRGVGLWGLCWLVALLGGFFWLRGDLVGDNERTIVLAALATLAATLVTWLLLGMLPNWRAERFAGRLGRIPKIGHSLSEFWRAVWMYRLKGRSVLVGLLLSLVGHVGFVLTFYCAARTVLEPGQMPSLAQHFLVVPIGMAIEGGFPSPGGVGGGEAAYGWVYTLIHPEWFAHGVWGSLVKRIISWVLGLVGYLVYLRMRPALRAAETLAQEADVEQRESAQETQGIQGRAGSRLRAGRQPQFLPDP